MVNATHLALAAAPANDAGAADDEATTADRRFRDELVALRTRLLSQAQFLAQDHDLANDLVQAALERALVARAQFHRGTDLRAWVSTILRNLFLDHRRQVSLRQCVEKEIAWEPVEHTVGPLDMLCWEDVLEVLEQSPRRDRELFKRFYVERRSYREISEESGTSEKTIGTRLFRLRKTLKRSLGKVYARRLAEIHRHRMRSG